MLRNNEIRNWRVGWRERERKKQLVYGEASWELLLDKVVINNMVNRIWPEYTQMVTKVFLPPLLAL